LNLALLTPQQIEQVTNPLQDEHIKRFDEHRNTGSYSFGTSWVNFRQ